MAGTPNEKLIWGGQLVGRVGVFDLVDRSFHSLTGSIVTARHEDPRVKPTRRAPSFPNNPEYRSIGILSSMGVITWQEKCESVPHRLLQERFQTTAL